MQGSGNFARKGGTASSLSRRACWPHGAKGNTPLCGNPDTDSRAELASQESLARNVPRLPRAFQQASSVAIPPYLVGATRRLPLGSRSLCPTYLFGGVCEHKGKLDSFSGVCAPRTGGRDNAAVPSSLFMRAGQAATRISLLGPQQAVLLQHLCFPQLSNHCQRDYHLGAAGQRNHGLLSHSTLDVVDPVLAHIVQRKNRDACGVGTASRHRDDSVSDYRCHAGTSLLLEDHIRLVRWLRRAEQIVELVSTKLDEDPVCIFWESR